MGTYWLGTDDKVGLRDCFLGGMPGECCREFAAKWNHPLKADGAALLAHIAKEHPEAAADIIASWMKVAFRACSLAGVSFGFYELREIAKGILDEVSETCASEIEQIPTKKPTEPEPDYNKPLEEIAMRAVKTVLKSGSARHSRTPLCRDGALPGPEARSRYVKSLLPAECSTPVPRVLTSMGLAGNISSASTH